VPELREVFEMATRKIEPDLHEWEEQERRQRRVTRNRKIAAIALSAALAVVAALFVLNALDLTDQDRENEVAGQPATLPSETGAYLFVLETQKAMRVPGIASSEVVGAQAVSPDGTMVAYQGTDPQGRDVIYVANVDGTNIRTLVAATAQDSFGAVQFSPDGSQIAYQVRPYGGTGEYVGDLFLVDIATGESTRLTHLKRVSSGLWWMGPTFSRDGQTIFFTRANGNTSWDLVSVPISGGRPTPVLRDAVGGRLSPDGRTIVYFRSKPSPDNPFLGDMWLADPDGTDARRLAVRADVFSAQWSPDGTKISYTKEQGPEGAYPSPLDVYVVDVTTGEIAKVLKDADAWPEWVDDHTWIIGVE
jgi:Tol biopolymer transport system component